LLLTKMVMKKLLVLALAAVGSADRIDDRLNAVVNEANAAKNKAEAHKNNDWTFSERNSLATDAGYDWYNRAKDQLGNARTVLLSELWDDYEHHKEWEEKFRRWGGFRNEYARDVHRRAKDSFYSAYNDIEDMMSTLSGSPDVKLNLIFANEGGSGGTFRQLIITGSKQASSINTQLASTISASVRGPIGALMGSASASASAAMQSSFSQSSFAYRENEIEIDLSEPIYIYQVVGNFKTGGGEGITINGSHQIFNSPINQA